MDDKINFIGVHQKRPIRVGNSTTVSAETGDVITETKNAWTVLPPPAGTCPECGVDHPFDEPHSRQSLTYQYQFYGKNGRWPTWTDAMSHCSEPARMAWRDLLIKVMREKGIAIPADLAAIDNE